MQTGTVRCWRCTGLAERHLFFWTQQFPLRCGNKLCASPTQRRFCFCQHNFLCWIWSSPTTDTHTELNSIISPASQSTLPLVLLLVYTRCKVEACYRKWNYIFNWESTHDSSLRSPPFGHRRNSKGSGRLWGRWLRILGPGISVLACSLPALTGIKPSLKLIFNDWIRPKYLS